MQRAKLILSYDGHHFNGFQRQKNTAHIKTVAGSLETALQRLGIKSHIVGAGRTDAGVHALNQVAHCEIPIFWNDRKKLLFHLNALVSPYIYIKSIQAVDDTFHARFSAQKRLYRYFLYDGMYQPFLSHYALHVKPVELEKINSLAHLLQGTHDFEFFKKEGGGTTQSVRTLFKAGAYRHQNFIVISFLGDAFLRSQVRMMVNMILSTHEGKFSKEQFLEQRDKKIQHSTHLSPASGLYLSRIYY